VLDPALLKPISNPWRNRILFEIHLRPMSPKQFSLAFDSLDTATISRYFRELKDWGFLEVADELRGGGRRGAAEKVYRAIRRVHFDTKNWSVMPRNLRDECSGVVLGSFVSRVTEAVRARLLDQGSSRYISTGVLHLDRASFGELGSYLDETLDWIARLEIEAGFRMMLTGERPTSQTAALFAFTSPQGHDGELSWPSVERLQLVTTGDQFLMNPLTAKAMCDPWRDRILRELYQRPMSPRRFGEEFGGPDLAMTARYFRQLKEWGFLEVAEEIRGGHRRGAVEKMYRSVRRSHFNSGPWQRLPAPFKKQEPNLQIDLLISHMEEAVLAGTLDEEIDRHTTWLVLWLDQQGWQECLQRLRETQAWINVLSERAAIRIRESDESALPVTAAVLGFRSPERFPWAELTSLPIGFAPDLTACRAAA